MAPYSRRASTPALRRRAGLAARRQRRRGARRAAGASGWRCARTPRPTTRRRSCPPSRRRRRPRAARRSRRAAAARRLAVPPAPPELALACQPLTRAAAEQPPSHAAAGATSRSQLSPSRRARALSCAHMKLVARPLDAPPAPEHAPPRCGDSHTTDGGGGEPASASASASAALASAAACRRRRKPARLAAALAHVPRLASHSPYCAHRWHSTASCTAPTRRRRRAPRPPVVRSGVAAARCEHLAELDVARNASRRRHAAVGRQRRRRVAPPRIRWPCALVSYRASRRPCVAKCGQLWSHQRLARSRSRGRARRAAWRFG